MSGKQHDLGSDEHWVMMDGEEVTEKIAWPSIGTADRAFALLSVRCAGWRRGYMDGMLLSARRTWPEANPVEAKHLKWHCEAAVRVIAPTIAATRLTADTLKDKWLGGWQAGFEAAYSTKGQAHSPGGDPDAHGE